jgi:hypothetical protein
MSPRLFLHSAWGRTTVAVFFLISGALVALLMMWAAPSFWYFPCAILWALSGFVWLIRPSFAPAISIFPVLGITVMLVQALPAYKQMDSLSLLVIFSVAIALALIAAAFRQQETRNVTALAVSFSLVLTAFVVDRLFTNKIEVRSYSMSWTANGTTPWGRVERNEKGELPVVIYRVVHQGYCFDAMFSSELASILTATNKPAVAVDYNVFKDFGHVRGYNVRDVDGMVFNDGNRSVRSEDSPGYGGRSGASDCH